MLEKLSIVTDRTSGGVETNTFVKFTSASVIENALTVIQLRPEEYYQQKIQDGNKKYQSKKAINANGYNRINRWLGVSFLAPDTILSDDGSKLPNPYIERENGETVRVRVRRVGIGRSSVGELQVIDLICVFDVRLYFASDVYNRLKFAEVKWGKLLPSKPERTDKYILPLPLGSACLELDFDNLAVQGLVREHIDRQKYADRNAITICQRNILNQFLGTRYADDDGRVSFTHWPKSTLSSDELEFVRTQLNEGMQVISLGGVVLSKKTETVNVDVENDEADIDNEE